MNSSECLYLRGKYILPASARRNHGMLGGPDIPDLPRDGDVISEEDLTEQTIRTGHWMAQEKPREVNAALVKWLATSVPGV
jgi:hypothetical protein